MGKKKTETKTVVKEDTSQQNWLSKNPQYQALVNSAIAEAANYSVPELKQAGLNDDIIQSLKNLSQGIDTSQYKSQSDYLTNLGKQYTQQGTQGLNQAQGILSQYANWTQEDMQKAMQSEYNADLVKEQIAGATADINEQTDEAVHSINQRANAAGALGSSRAGVAEGVTRGKALRAIGQASVQYRTAEESAAYNRLMGYVSTRTAAAQSQAGIAQNQLSYGMQAGSLGMNYLNQANQISLQNTQNRLTAGEYMRQYQQQTEDIANYNNMLRQSTSLQRLMYVNQGLGPIANYSTYGTTNSNTKSSTTSSGGGMGAAMGMIGTVAGGVMGSVVPGLGTVVGAQLGGMVGGMAGGAMGG